MSSIEIHREKQQLIYVFQLVKNINDIETQSHWARYLCILVSGFLENSIKYLITDYSLNTSNEKVAKYVQSTTKNITNLNHEKIKQLLRSFSTLWCDDFEENVDESGKLALDSIVALRNNIAHGRSVGTTYSRIRSYFDKVVDIIDYLERDCIT